MTDSSSIGSILSARVHSHSHDAPRLNVQVVELPAELSRGERPERVRGSVVRVSSSNEVTVRTPRGEVRVQADENSRVKAGDQVDIRLEAGNPRTAGFIRVVDVTLQDVEPPAVNRKSAPPLPRALSAAELVISEVPFSLRPLQGSEAYKVVQTSSEADKTVFLPSGISYGTLVFPLDEGGLRASLVSVQGDFTVPIADVFVPPADSPFQVDHVFPVDLAKPILDIPLSYVVAQSISSPALEPIFLALNDLGTAVTHLPPLITQSFVDHVYAPPVFVHAFDDAPRLGQFITRDFARAGEIHVVLLGFNVEQNLPILQVTTPGRFSEQFYVMDTPLRDVAVGSVLSLNIVPIETGSGKVSTQNLTPPLVPAYFLTPGNWAIFQEIVAALPAVPIQSSAGAHVVLPSASSPAQIAPAAMFFVAAMRSGDVSGWLGDRTIDVLRTTGKSGLIHRIGREMLGLARLNAEPVSQEWRALSLPLAWQDEVHRLVVHYRREDERSAKNNPKAGDNTRFVMDLSLSRMGKVQLDALFLRQTGSARLDLVLRAEQSFSEAMRHQMRESYKSALEQTQMTGALSFQSNPDGWVRITPDTISEYTRDV